MEKWLAPEVPCGVPKGEVRVHMIRSFVNHGSLIFFFRNAWSGQVQRRLMPVWVCVVYVVIGM